MKLHKDSSKQLRDLLFELVEGGRSKFLIVLCDNVWLRRHLEREIDRELRWQRNRVARVSAPRQYENVFRTIIQQSRRKKVSAIYLHSLDRLGSARQHKVFAELNFHRDALSRLGVPIVIWLPPRLLPRI